jgi:hypothetical protein
MTTLYRKQDNRSKGNALQDSTMVKRVVLFRLIRDTTFTIERVEDGKVHMYTGAFEYKPRGSAVRKHYLGCGQRLRPRTLRTRRPSSPQGCWVDRLMLSLLSFNTYST